MSFGDFGCLQGPWGACTSGTTVTPSVPGFCSLILLLGRLCICGLCAGVTDPIVVIDGTSNATTAHLMLQVTPAEPHGTPLQLGP